MRAELLVGDCRERLRELVDASIDAVVTDPPYELAFMGRKWDASGVAYSVDLWREVLRVLKPGGHLLAFGGTRTYHRMACAIEDAGFEVRDSIHWMYGSGFPKSLNVSKAIDKAAGVEFDQVPASGVGFMNAEGAGGYNVTKNRLVRKGESTGPATEWEGWGTALKPAHEPIVVARKPLDGTVAANVLAHGIGALNIDGCRVRLGVDEDTRRNPVATSGWCLSGSPTSGSMDDSALSGRWPPNVVFAHLPACGEECVAGCPIASLEAEAAGASRFFPAFRYQAKPSRKERGPAVAHPTVKPIELMRWLVRLVTPKGGTVLDPFTGSGTTGVAALLEGFRFIGCEREPEYVTIVQARMAAAEAAIETQQPTLFDLAGVA